MRRRSANATWRSWVQAGCAAGRRDVQGPVVLGVLGSGGPTRLRPSGMVASEVPMLLPFLVLPLSAIAAPPPEMRVHLIDVGQGAATLVEFPCGAMLVDTGGEQTSHFDSNAMLTSYLDAFFLRRPELDRTLDLLVVSHPHIDHVRGTPAVLAAYNPRNVVDDGLPGRQQDAVSAVAALHTYVETNATSVRHKDVTLKDFRASGRPYTSAILDPFKECQGVNPKVSALWGQVLTDPGWGTDHEKLRFDNENNHSVATRVDFGEASILITGDMQDVAIADMLAARSPESIDVDLYQVGHHGSDNGTTLPLLRAMTPEIALIGAGSPDREEDWTAWAYGHPRQRIVEMLEREVSGRRDQVDVSVGKGVKAFEQAELSAAVYGTGWDGTVVLSADALGHFTRVEPDWSPAPQVVAASVATAVPAPASVSGNLKVTFADVDEGDAILLQLGELDFLVDAGKSSNADRYLGGVLAALHGPLEYFVLSHPHIDHYGGAAAVLGNSDVRHVVTSGERRGPPRDPKESGTWNDFEAAVKAEGLTIKVAELGTELLNERGLRISVLSSGGNFDDTSDGEDINNDSVVLLVEYGGRRLLLTGDIEVASGKRLVKTYCPSGPAVCPSLEVDILKVPHHGSASFDPNFFTATSPTWAVFSAGYELNNSHWLPRVVTLDALRLKGAKVLSTSAEGTHPVVVEISSAGEISWDAPEQAAFFWTKADGEWVGVEVPQGE